MSLEHDYKMDSKKLGNMKYSIGKLWMLWIKQNNYENVHSVLLEPQLHKTQENIYVPISVPSEINAGISHVHFYKINFVGKKNQKAKTDNVVELFFS